MAQAQIYTGSWDDLVAHREDFRGRNNLTLIVPVEPTIPRNETMTPQERIQAMDALAARNRHLPVLSEEAFDRENLYEERL